jgi:hypothetical protein
MKLTKEQVVNLKWFVTAGKARAEHAIPKCSSDDETAFYRAIVDKADALLPLLTRREPVEIEDEEEI